jgi:DNA helicase II / ATP-dependent DNA helicase PcrA
LIAELLGCGPATKKAMQGYARLINALRIRIATAPRCSWWKRSGAEGYPLLAEAVERVRTNRVIRQPGYDGEFGVIKVFSEGERAELCGQGLLFGPAVREALSKKKGQAGQLILYRAETETSTDSAVSKGLNDEQMQAVVSTAARILVQAGPGTGKTHTLVARVLRTALHSPLPCTVITFTNKAAEEVRARIQGQPAMTEQKYWWLPSTVIA